MKTTNIIDLFLSQQDEAFTHAVQAYEQHDLTRALAAFEQLAQRDDPQAQMNLAFMLRDGHGVAQDPVAACMWLSVAARSGDVEAIQEQNRLQSTLSAPQRLLAAQKAAAWTPAA
ncbi:MAG: sel1 repeat family protein [Magnetococcales bacterium]|nr:sel1 repeat family protein [Magnetococcales bacterium]